MTSADSVVSVQKGDILNKTLKIAHVAHKLILAVDY